MESRIIKGEQYTYVEKREGHTGLCIDNRVQKIKGGNLQENGKGCFSLWGIGS